MPMKKLNFPQQSLRRAGRFVLAVTAIGLLTGWLLNWLFPLPPPPSYSMLITDHRGEVLQAFLSRDDKWRMKTELNEITPDLRKAIIYKEDKYFYYHPGVNPAAIVRALVNNLLR